MVRGIRYRAHLGTQLTFKISHVVSLYVHRAGPIFLNFVALYRLSVEFEYIDF